jgi:alpha-glucosidase
MRTCRLATVMVLASGLVVGQVRAAPTANATSPNGLVRIELSLRKAGDAESVPHYRVTFRDREVVANSRLGVEMVDGVVLGGPCTISGVEEKTVLQEYVQVTGKRRAVVARGVEVVVRLRELAPTRRTWEVVLRAHDDGAALRYRFPRQEGWDALAIKQERTEFRFPAEARAFALPLNGFTTSYEKRYAVKLVKDLPKNWLLGLPLLVEAGGGRWAAVTEANVTEYAGLYLAPAGDGLLASRLSPLPTEPGVAVRHELPHVSPWRVVMLGDHVGRLVESDLVLNLSEPLALSDTSWIKTGKTTFPWWNGFHEEKVAFKLGLNTATAKHYVDFCAAAGIPYHSLDGVGNTAWYGGPIVPYKGADPTQAIDGLDLPEVLTYAKGKGVRIRLWMNWQAAAAFMHKAFPLYRAWGIEGVMLDFMDRDDQGMNRFVRKAVALAAENRLTVTLHGCPKPTGLERTYPNLLTHEAVMNLEYDKWDKVGITPDHEVTVPFTRMLAGPLDFHQGSFRTVPPEAFKPRIDAPLVIGTPARTLASYVTYQNHLSMVADYPTAYQGHPALAALVKIPTTWDDTKVLDGKVGEFIVIARRSGDAWHVGAMTDRQARTLKAPLQFLGPGQYRVEEWHDDGAAPYGIARRDAQTSAADELVLKLAASGGAYVKLTPRQPG